MIATRVQEKRLARSTVITLRGLHRKSTEHNLDPAFTSLDA
jgi:hypothetical protein